MTTTSIGIAGRSICADKVKHTSSLAVERLRVQVFGEGPDKRDELDLLIYLETLKGRKESCPLRFEWFEFRRS